jgi:hypothetical protein
VLVDAASGQKPPDAVALSVLVVTSSWCVVFVNLAATDWAPGIEIVHTPTNIVTLAPAGIVSVTSHEPALQLMMLSVQVPTALNVTEAVLPLSVYLQLANDGLPEMLDPPRMVPVKPPEEHVTVKPAE